MTQENTRRSVGRPCSVCSHAGRWEIDAELISGASVTQIARRFGISTDSAYRHLRSHVAPAARDALLGPGSLPAADLAQRVLDVADAARDLRITAVTSGRRGDALKAMGSELKALGTLSERLGVTDSDVLAELNQLSTLVTALARLMRRSPDVGAALALELRDDGHLDLALEIESVMQAHINTQIGN